MKICGIDEAGRGPVIGPLVLCAVMIDEQDAGKLRQIGVKDSKALTPDQRLRISEEVKKVVTDFKLKIVSIAEIDKAVESEESNLNWLEARKSVELLNSLKPDRAYIDCPSNNINAYTDYLRQYLPEKMEVVCAHKADAKYETVSAASIIAKVVRDSEIAKIKARYRIEFGSGYPSDPFTRQFVQENYSKYPIFRKSWASWKNVARKNGQKKIFEY
ncbi:MAG: ribonuclease HII [archaeon]